MDPEEKRKQLEIDILRIMEEKLRVGEMDADRAREIARMMLDKLHPPMSLEQIYAVAPTLDDHFTELSRAILPLQKEHEEQVREIVTKHAEELIRSGKLDEAMILIKQTTTSTNAGGK